MKVKFKATDEEFEIYGVRKSGPANDGSQTKFLIYKDWNLEWVWIPADSFAPCQVISK